MTEAIASGEALEPCDACGGRGRRPMLPDRFNPFRAGAVAAAQAMVDSLCLNCGGTGKKVQHDK